MWKKPAMLTFITTCATTTGLFLFTPKEKIKEYKRQYKIRFYNNQWKVYFDKAGRKNNNMKIKMFENNNNTVKLQKNIYEKIFNNENKKINLMINPNVTFMQYILKTNVETHMLFDSKKDVINFMESINHNIVWKAICVLDNFKTKLVTILQNSHKENKLSSKTFDKNNYIIEKKQTTTVVYDMDDGNNDSDDDDDDNSNGINNSYVMKKFLNTLLEYESSHSLNNNNVKNNFDDDDNDDVLQKKNATINNVNRKTNAIILPITFMQTIHDLIAINEFVQQTNNTNVFFTGKHPFVSYTGVFNLIPENQRMKIINENFKIIYFTASAMTNFMYAITSAATTFDETNVNTIDNNHNQGHKVDINITQSDVDKLGKYFDCMKKTNLARYENSPYEDVPLWNFYTIACNLHQSIEMNGVNKLIQSTTNVNVFNGITGISDDDNSSSTIIETKYVDENKMLNIFHGFSKHLLEFMDLGIIECHVMENNNLEEESPLELTEENNSTTTIFSSNDDDLFNSDENKEDDESCYILNGDDVVIVERREHDDEKITGKFTVKPLFSYIFTNYIYGDIKGNVDLENSKRRWMTDRSIVSESIIDLQQMKKEEEKMITDEKIHRETWKHAKKQYKTDEEDGGLTKKQFQRVMIELRERDHHFIVMRREFERRKNDIETAKRRAIERLKRRSV